MHPQHRRPQNLFIPSHCPTPPFLLQVRLLDIVLGLYLEKDPQKRKERLRKTKLMKILTGQDLEATGI